MQEEAQEEAHIVKASSQYRNSTLVQRKLSFKRKSAVMRPVQTDAIETILYKRVGIKYVKRWFSIRNGELCYRNDDDTIINGGYIASSQVTNASRCEFVIYTSQREFRLRAVDNNTLHFWLQRSHTSI